MKIRTTTPQDSAKLSEWINGDPDHSGKCNAEFWLPGDPAANCITVENDQGEIAFFVRTENLLRVHIQFGPNKARTAKALLQFLPRLAKDAKARGYKQLIWTSVSKSLINFTKFLGHHPSPNEIVKDL